MTTTKTPNGIYIHGKTTHVGSGTYRRSDEYTSDRTGEKSRDLLFANSATDDSPIHLGPYTSACSCCYLNFSHTTELHNSRA